MESYYYEFSTLPFFKWDTWLELSRYCSTAGDWICARTEWGGEVELWVVKHEL